MGEEAGMSEEKWETVDIRAKITGSVVSMKWTETSEHEQIIPLVDLEQLPHFATIIAERDALREALQSVAWIEMYNEDGTKCRGCMKCPGQYPNHKESCIVGNALKWATE